jgi:hypothetical protein
MLRGFTKHLVRANRSSYVAAFAASCLTHSQPPGRLCMENKEVLCPLLEASGGSPTVQAVAAKVWTLEDLPLRDLN